MYYYHMHLCMIVIHIAISGQSQHVHATHQTLYMCMICMYVHYICMYVYLLLCPLSNIIIISLTSYTHILNIIQPTTSTFSHTRPFILPNFRLLLFLASSLFVYLPHPRVCCVLRFYRRFVVLMIPMFPTPSPLTSF